MDTTKHETNVAVDPNAKAVEPKTNESRLSAKLSKSQYGKVVKTLFGPLARIKYYEGRVEVYTEKEATKTFLGSGVDAKTAIDDAAKMVDDAQKHGKVLADLVPGRLPRNVVADKRRDLMVKLPETDGDVIKQLHDNEVLDICSLIELRDFEAISPYIAKATIRNEKYKAFVAATKAAEEAAAAKAAVEAAKTETPTLKEMAAMQGIELSDGPQSDNLFNVPTEDTVVPDGVTLTEDMIADVFRKP